ncbi:MAG: YchJ family metal-binding protein [Cryobacterium sp.]
MPDSDPLPPRPTRCPCLSGETYSGCCERLHRGDAAAPTAEILMRARYSAFAMGETAYLLRTWHPSTRPATLELDHEQQWVRLDVERLVRGGPLDTVGVVEFTAYFRHHGKRHQQHEASRFVREHRIWFYVDELD